MHGNGISRNPTHWKLRKAGKAAARECEALKTQLVILRTDMQTREGQIRKLELVVRERNQRIDQQAATIDQLREQNKRLDAENDRLAEMVKLS
jgi:exoribonuclease R